MARPRPSTAVAVLILAIGLVGIGVYAWPGYMSLDSVTQLREARAGVYTDWHPPLMAALWRVVEHVVSGPAGMFVLQCTSFVIGIYLVLRRAVSPIVAATVTTLLLWFPPVAATMAVVWKDCQMAGYLALGTALLLSDRRWVKVIGLGVLALATGMRHNAFTMTFALVVLLFVWTPGVTQMRRTAIALAVWLAITAVGVLANVALTSEATHPWAGSVALFDIMGVVRFSPDLSDADIRDALDGVPLLPTTDIRRKTRYAYSPVDGVFSLLDKGIVRQPSTPAENAAIGRAWRTLVLHHPMAYLRHRYHAFGALLGLDDDQRQSVWVGYDGLGWDLITDANDPTQWWLRDRALELGKTWLFHPYLYLLAILVLLPPCIYWGARVPLAFALSALGSEAALYFISPTPDFRYSLWLIPCLAVIAVMLARRALAKPAELG